LNKAQLGGNQGWGVERARHNIFILFYLNHVFMICCEIDSLSSNVTSGIILSTRFEFSDVFLE